MSDTKNNKTWDCQKEEPTTQLADHSAAETVEPQPFRKCVECDPYSGDVSCLDCFERSRRLRTAAAIARRLRGKRYDVGK